MIDVFVVFIVTLLIGCIAGILSHFWGIYGILFCILGTVVAFGFMGGNKK